MRFDVFNQTTNRILTWVTEPKGSLPAGYDFRSELDVPPNAIMEAPAQNSPVPESVSRRQFRGALRRVGLFDAVDNLRNDPDLDEITRGDLVDFLDAATVIERNHPMIAAFAPKLGVTPEQIDRVFIIADTL